MIFMKVIHSPIFWDVFIYKNFIVHINKKDFIFKINSPRDLIDFGVTIAYSEINDFMRKNEDNSFDSYKLRHYIDNIKKELEENQDNDVYLVEEISNLTEIEKTLLAVGSADLQTLTRLMNEPANIKIFLFRNSNAASLFKTLFFDLLKENKDTLVSEFILTTNRFKLINFKHFGTAITSEQARELFYLCDDNEVKFYLGILFNFEQVDEEFFKTLIFNKDSKMRYLGYKLDSKRVDKFLIKSFFNEELTIDERDYILGCIKDKPKEVIDYVFNQNNIAFYINLARDTNLDGETIANLYQIYDKTGKIMEVLFYNQHENPNIPDFFAIEGFNLLDKACHYQRERFLLNHFDKIDKETLNKIIVEKKVDLIRVIAEQLKKHPEKKDLLNWLSKIIIYSKIYIFF